MIGIIALSLFGNIPIPGGSELAVKQAKEDLSERKGVDKKEIVVVAIEPVDWPDSSLGCPEPEMMYAQVLTPGYKILLSYKEETYKYHSDKGNRVVFCGSSR